MKTAGGQFLSVKDDLGEDVHVTPGGKNLRPDAVIDYMTSQVTAEDLRNQSKRRLL